MKKMCAFALAASMLSLGSASFAETGVQFLEGSWKHSCKDYDINKAIQTGVLTANCKVRRGPGYKQTFVVLSQCTKPIENHDGNLVCK